MRAVNEALAGSDYRTCPHPVRCAWREFRYGRRIPGPSTEGLEGCGSGVRVLLHVYVAGTRAMAISPSKHQIEHKQDAQPVLDAAEARIRKDRSSSWNCCRC